MKNAEAEVSNKDLYRHIIINDRLEIAQKQLIEIVGRYRKIRNKK